MEGGRDSSHKGHKGGEERGRDVYIEKQENRFADRNAIGVRMGGDNLDNWGQLFQSAQPERAASGIAGVAVRRWAFSR